jgi:CDP-paratose 2-epimerase
MLQASERGSGPLRIPNRPRPVLVTGGAGFIGTNLAHRLLSEGTPVRLLDNLSRPGVERNLEWLCRAHGPLVQIAVDDVRNARAVRLAVSDVDQVFHFAAQVAVTSSLGDPVNDFDVNARGTLTLLEAVRDTGGRASIVYTSTNKVYGALSDVPLQARPRYEPVDAALCATGVGEDRPLDFHSPYGCSKGTADQYVLDYARSFRMRTAVFRMSCIYGPHQCGTEDQGWLAHFLLRAVAGQPIVIYGDGHQVRDVLYVDDLVDALLLAQQAMPGVAGHAFNMGGGPARTTSLLELVGRLRSLVGTPPALTFKAWRIGDQRYYVSDTRKFTRLTGWLPRVDLGEGLARLHAWLRDAAPPAALEFRRAAR